MNQMCKPANSLWNRCACVAVVMAALAGICATARAQNVPHPVALPLESVTETLADAGVRVPPQAILAAYSEYLDGYLPELAKADAGLRALLAQMHVEDDPIYGPRDASRFNDVERQSMEAERRLAGAMLDAIAVHAPGQDAACALARKLLELEVLQTHLLSKGRMVRHNRMAEDVRMWGNFVANWAGDQLSPQAQEEIIRRIATTNLDDRLAATRAYAESSQAHRMEVAKWADRVKVSGMSMQQANDVASAKAMHALSSAGEGKEGQDAYNRTIAEFDFALLYSTSSGPAPWHPARVAYFQAQYKACKQALETLPEALNQVYAWGWLGQMMGTDDSRGRSYPRDLFEGLPLPPGVYAQRPSDYAYALARIQGLTPEVQKQLRTLGDAWMADDRAIITDAAERMATTGIYEDVRQLRRNRAEKAINEAADALGAPEMRTDNQRGQPVFANVKLGPELPEEDQRHYGRFFRKPTPSGTAPSATSEAARSWSFGTGPLEYTPAIEADLCSLLRLTDSERLLVSTVFADARERWAAQVEPLALAAREPRLASLQLRAEERDEFNAKLQAAFAKSTECFQAAIASDQALFDALRAALGAEASADALTVAQLSRRTLEAFGSDLDDDRKNSALPLDVPRAVLTAPLSPAGRKAALAVVAASASEWNTLAVNRRELLRQNLLSAMTPPELNDSGTWEASQKERDALAAQRSAVDQSWRAMADAACAQIAAALDAADAEAWQRSLLPLLWPKWYPVLRTDLPGPQELLAAQRQRLRAAGDQIMACLEDLRARKELKPGGDRIGVSRRAAFEAYINNLKDVALELLRAAAPPADASRIPRTRLQATLDRYSSRVSAAATAPATPSAPSHAAAP